MKTHLIISAQCLGWALLHFLWQGVALALVLKFAFFLLRDRSAHLRYLVACTAMGLLALAPILTFCVLSAQNTDPSLELQRTRVASSVGPQLPMPQSVPQQVVVHLAARQPGEATHVREFLERQLQWVVLTWLAGVVLLGFRMTLGWRQAKRLVYYARALPEPEWAGCLNRAARRMGVTRPVRLLQSACVEVPTVLGWLRPIIILPVGCLTGLTPGQWEAILLHELGHVRRHDYIANLAQSLIEVLLFYHPAVWWVSRQIRIEREHCCDDLVVATCGDPIAYARALANLEESRSTSVQLALAATGASLLGRIRRILGRPVENQLGGGWFAGMLALTTVAFLLVAERNNLLAQSDQLQPSSVSSAASASPGESTPVPGKIGTETEPMLSKSSNDSSAPVPTVMIEIKFIEVGQTEMNESSLGPLVVGSAADANLSFAQLQITNRNGIVSQPMLDDKGKFVGQLFDNPGLRNVEQVTRGSAFRITPDRFQAILRTLEQKSSAHVLSAPRITTFSGRQAAIQVVELKQVVTGVSISTDSDNKTRANYLTSALPMGPAVEVFPEVFPDGQTIRLTAIPTWTEFLGYEEPRSPIVHRADDQAKPLQVQRPLPHIQVRQTLVDMTVRDGQTIVISGFGDLQNSGKNATTQSPKGLFFKSRATSKRQLIVFVTPVIVDSTGSRVHPD